MLTKFETKSKRVKGISFHPNRPWVLASLHTGVIQLWDYRVRVLIDKFDEHDGPVRGICFHLSQPLFVSGGDDYKIRVWNYKQRKCLFTLMGHLDYIRTVQFHHENPWILSSSDDQTIRIWNWQSRSCISILTGHNHYVMCAQFHPSESLIVSASLDQTVRVWDITGLRCKSYKHPSDESNLNLPQNDLFGNTDALVMHVLEGHDRGVNWAAFHPEDSLIVSGADDRLVKFWRMSDTRAYEVDTLRGHLNNVSCVMFHPRKPLILSNSEDMTIRVWDLSRRISLKIFRRDQDKDRFWTMAAHPEQDLFGAGHDSGLVVFKLEHERPAYCVDGDILYYVKDKLYAFDYKQNKSIPLINIRKKNGLDTAPRFLHYNAAERAILVMNNSSYELYQVPKQPGQSSEPIPSGSDKKGTNLACFVARNRFAVLDAVAQKIYIKNLEQKVTKELSLPKEDGGSGLNFDKIWPATTGSVLLRDGTRSVWLYDLQRKKAVSKVVASHIKLVSWSGNDKDALVALMGRDGLVIANRDLNLLCTVHEIDRIKSGAWHPSGVFLYTTLTHLKYCLPNGDSGIIRTLSVPLFIYASAASKVFALDRKCRTRVVNIDATEFLLKQAVVTKDYPKILSLVQKFGLLGQSIIAYLQKKGYPELALHFVKDEKTRFNLAIECGNLTVAVTAAKAVDEAACWHRLGTEALRQGNHQVVEMAYQRTKNFEKLSFLYLITGNIDKLRRMLTIAEKRGDVMSQFQNALYLGDMDAVAQILFKSGQLGLAHSAAATFGLETEAEWRELLEKTQPQIPASNPQAQLLNPPIPISSVTESNWPLLTVQKSLIQQMIVDDGKKSGTSLQQDESAMDDEPVGWGEPDLDLDDGSAPIPDEDLELAPPDDEDLGEGSGWDLDLEGLEDIKTPAKASSTGFFVAPRAGRSHSEIWTANSNLAADHVAAGNVESAMQLLNSQVGIVQFAPLKSQFVNIFVGANVCLSTYPGVPMLPQGLERETGFPLLTTTLVSLIDLLKLAYKSTTAGKFAEAITFLQEILHGLLFVVVTSREEEMEALELLGLVREYLTGLKTEIKRKEVINEDKTRMCELAAYFTHTNLQPMHLMLSLSSAMSCAYKIQNYKDASSFAKRLLELNPKPNIASQAKKVIAFADKNNTNAVQLDYDERNPFVLCCGSFTPIYKGSESISCPYCKANYLPKFKGSVCNLCELAEVGRECSGLVLHMRKSRR